MRHAGDERIGEFTRAWSSLSDWHADCVAPSMAQSPPPRVDSKRRGRAPRAAYANYFEVVHNAFEFLIDFGQFDPDAAAVTMHSRIATGPAHAKLLAQLLAGAIARFEAEHGAIAELAEPAFEMLLVPPADFERRAALARADARSSEPVRKDASDVARFSRPRIR